MKFQQDTQPQDQAALIPIGGEPSVPGFVPSTASSSALDGIPETHVELSAKWRLLEISQADQQDPFEAILDPTVPPFGDDFGWSWPPYQEQLDFSSDSNNLASVQR